MKLFTVAALCIAAFTQAAAYDEVTECPIEEILKLRALAEEPARPTCEAVSGYTFIPPPGEPTPAQILLMCLTPECKTTINTLISINPADCVLVLGDVRINVKKLAESYKPACQALGIEV
ncbi:hypothetical protein Poli38472_009122 [Pythium oligandrum]|uniref:Elicitin n=1 Tax=Pythium oligandrum TaxID=41045 RepID=A0A8K1CLQ9_PYTOL|nr:hypothetical protein Poli38472_009122 [Pythium oligandrum]|eukprot:TMW64955.1 hypothetical protein Poli38472_009122 [Pythium oligandrum]